MRQQLVCSKLCSLEVKNHRKKSGQKGPLDVFQSLFCSEQRKDCKELPFELREHNDLNETGTKTVPSTWHTAFLGHSLLLHPLTGTDSLCLPIPYGWNLYFLPL